MSHTSHLRPLGLAVALLLVGACGIPRLRQIPGSDRVTRSSPRPKAVAGRAVGAGCGGRQVPVTMNGGNGTPGDGGGVCGEVTTDTVPDPNTDHSAPPRRIP